MVCFHYVVPVSSLCVFCLLLYNKIPLRSEIAYKNISTIFQRHSNVMTWNKKLFSYLSLIKEPVSIRNSFQLQQRNKLYAVMRLNSTSVAYVLHRFVDRENELREAKPAAPQPSQRAPLDPWTKSRASQQWAGPKVSKNSGTEGLWVLKKLFIFIMCFRELFLSLDTLIRRFIL